MEDLVLRKQDLVKCALSLPSALVEILSELREQLVVAGGYVRACVTGEEAADVDVFCSDQKVAAEASARLAVSLGGGTELYAGSFASTVRSPRTMAYPVQFIHRWAFENPAALIGGFDFSVTTAAFWWGRGEEARYESVVGPYFYPDVASRTLRYLAPDRDESPGDGLLRVLKYYRKGYRISLDDLGKVVARLACAEDGERGFPDNEVVRAGELADLLRKADLGSDSNGAFLVAGRSPKGKE